MIKEIVALNERGELIHVLIYLGMGNSIIYDYHEQPHKPEDCKLANKNET